MDIIQPKSHIIIKQGNDLQLFQLSNNPRFQGIELANVIGKPFWTIFRKEFTKGKNGILVQCDPGEWDTDLNLRKNHAECGSDNRHIQDNNNAQSLTKEEILNMKDEGVSSQDIVMKLIENSTTFTHKTEYAQQKYLRKKAKKYTDYIQILKPNLRLITEILLKKGSAQLLGMRVDTLSQIITGVNIQAEGTYLVYENNCQGLVLASMLNSISENGKILNITTPKYPFDKLRALNVLKFTKSNQDCFMNVPIASFLKYSKSNECDIKSVSEPVLLDGTLKRTITSVEPESKKTTHQEREDDEVRTLLQKKADGLVIACRQVPNDLLKELLQFLAPSRSFVVYSQYQEPLVKLYQELRNRTDVVCVRLIENWLRSYQILPERTHPQITMSGTGGYLLTGITVLNDESM